MEIAESRIRYYKRDGKGTPIVLLHSINAAASSFEMRPVFEHLAALTQRPIYALEWLGFGLSDRPSVRYSPGLYQRVLRRFLSNYVKAAADVVALSLAGEYAATVANAYPTLVNRMVFISPTGLSRDPQESVLQRAVVGVASSVGTFEVFFARLTKKPALRSFFAERIFLSPDKVPQELVDYAYVTSHVRGAHHAPRRFVQGLLSMGEYAPRAYANLKTPTLFVIPESDDDMVQDFVRAPEIASGNAEHVRVATVRSGLLPQWEAPEEVFRMMDEFLGVEARVPVPVEG
jgi:pimeloyl-ACP methyl ester carboxylesterase